MSIDDDFEPAVWHVFECDVEVVMGRGAYWEALTVWEDAEACALAERALMLGLKVEISVVDR